MLVPLPMLDLHLVCPSLVSSWLPCSAAIPIWRGRPSWPRGTNRVSPPGSSIPKVLLICPNIPSFLLILKLISREPAMDWPGYHRLFLNFTWWQFVLVLCVLSCSLFSCHPALSFWWCIILVLNASKALCIWKLLVAPSRWQTGGRVVNCNSFSVLLCSVYIIRFCIVVLSYWYCVLRRPCVFENCRLPPADGGLVEGLWILIPLVCYCVMFT